jgi:hypothetical protein
VHFLAVAARAMRQVLVDRARARASAKRGGDPLRVTRVDELAEPAPGEDVLALHAALEALEAEDADAAQVVVYRFFGGLTEVETGELMNRSERWVRGVLEGASDEELDMRSAARWPESFHQGVLPWSEAPALIEILAHGRLRPSHARVRWLSRVTAAAPGLEFRVRHRVAMALELWEAGRQEEPWEDLKTIEAVLAGIRDPVDLAEIKVGRFMNFGAASEWFGDPGQVAPSLPELGDVTSGFPITVDDNAVEAE